MGEVESGSVLESKTQGAIKADMRAPDQPGDFEPGRGERQTGGKAGEGADVRVCRIVGDGAEAISSQIAEKRNIGREEEQGERAPAEPRLVVLDRRGGSDSETF